MYGSYKSQGLVLLGVHGDPDWAQAVAVAKSEGIKYPITNDIDQKTLGAYKIEYYPTVFVLDKKGVIRAVDPADLDATVKKLLKAK